MPVQMPNFQRDLLFLCSLCVRPLSRKDFANGWQPLKRLIRSVFAPYVRSRAHNDLVVAMDYWPQLHEREAAAISSRF